jgi:phosphoglucomutase
MDKMAGIMAGLREKPLTEIGGYAVTKVVDYADSAATGMPAANVLVYSLEGGATVIVRPSGTEPKIKTYFTTLGKDLAEAEAQKNVLAAALKPILA